MKYLSSASRWHHCHFLDLWSSYWVHPASCTAELVFLSMFEHLMAFTSFLMELSVTISTNVFFCTLLLSSSTGSFQFHFQKLFANVNASRSLCVSLCHYTGLCEQTKRKTAAALS